MPLMLLWVVLTRARGTIPLLGYVVMIMIRSLDRLCPLFSALRVSHPVGRPSPPLSPPPRGPTPSDSGLNMRRSPTLMCTRAQVEWFCFPQGLFLLSAASQPAPHVSSFVRFTSGVRSYGLCLTFYRQVDVLEESNPFVTDAASRGALPERGRGRGRRRVAVGRGMRLRRRMLTTSRCLDSRRVVDK